MFVINLCINVIKKYIFYLFYIYYVQKYILMNYYMLKFFVFCTNMINISMTCK